MDKPKVQSRNARRPAKAPGSSSASVALPAVAKMLNQKGESGSGRASSASGSAIADSSPSRPSTPDVAGTVAASAPMPKYRYTREELLNLMNSPLSKIKPEICSSLHKLFDGNCREGDSYTFEDQASMRQAMAIRKHLNLGGEPQSFTNPANAGHDGDQHIALVPLRHSFSSGCHVTSSSSGNVNSPELKRERNRRDGHRIGSGRIQISDKHLERDMRDHRALCDREQDHDDRRYDRSGSSGIKVLKRDYEGRRPDGGRGGRYVGGSRNGREDPEWFTDGPQSQSETIELYGFDQGHGSKSRPNDVSDGVPTRKATVKQVAEEVGAVTVARETGRNEVKDVCSSKVEESEGKTDGAPLAERNSPRPSVSSSNQKPNESEKEQGPAHRQLQSSSPAAAVSPLQNADAELDFNAIFNIDSIPGLNEMFGLEPEQTKSGSSRFKQWFQFSSHGNSHCGESRRSSLTDEFGYINDIICGHNSPLGALSPPMPQPSGGPNVYSADKCSSETQNILELLQKAHNDAAADLRSTSLRGGSALNVPPHPLANNPDVGSPFKHPSLNSVDSKVDMKTVEAGLKAILSGSALSNSLLAALPSMAHLGSLTSGPPSGAKVVLAEELEAQLVPASSDRSESSRDATASSLSHPSNCRTSADNSLSHLTSRSGNNSGNLSFCSLPVLPIGTKVTLLSELEAGLRGLSIAGRAAPGNCQPPDGSTDSNPSLSSAAGRPVSSHGSGVSPAVLSVNAFSNRMTDLAAYKRLLGLVMDPYGNQTAADASLPIVTSPTSASMSSLEANQPNNSLANNQRDFIQRYLLQQQQLKMLNHPLPPHSEGLVLAPSGIPQHILSPDLPHPLFMAAGPFVDQAPSGQAVPPSSHGSNVPHLLEPSAIYRCPSAGPSLSLQMEDDFAMLPGGLAHEFCGGHFVAGSHQLPNENQLYQPSGRGGEGHTNEGHNLLLQCLDTMSGKQLPGGVKNLLPNPASNHAGPSHQAVLQNHQQQAVKMMHLAVQDKFGNSVKAGLNKQAAQSPIPPPHLTFQPSIVHPAAAVTTLPSPGIPILAPQTLLQQPPQSPRRAPSPLMFGSQPPMNLTAPLPVHLGPMTPILSPTLSPNTLQVTQPGSNLSSPAMRVPSPQELSGLAQSILQNALIKKQLEEQKERFIKRQQKQNKSPKPQPSLFVAATTAPNSKPSSVTSASAAIMNSNVLEPGKAVPSSFLPTSVLRKMVNTKMEEKLSGRFSEAEKNVPLLKVVKPDEEDDAEGDDERNSKANQNVSAKVEDQNGVTKLDTGDQLSDASTKYEPTEDGSRKLDTVSSVDPGRYPSSAQTSAGCGVDDAGTRPSAARRLVGQGFMNLNSSGSSSTDMSGHQVLADPIAGLPQFSGVAGFVPSGRQIKGKKLEHVPISLPLPSGMIKNKAGQQMNALRQQQLQQAQFLMANSNGGRGAMGTPVNALHALEMAKLLEQQQNIGLVSPVPVLPSAAPPPVGAQFISPLPSENGVFGVKQVPRMMVHPQYGVNSSASNALLLQRLGRSNMQRAAIPSVNHLNLNQLALIQAIQLQSQQQQQQQQQMWNRSPIRPPTANRPACPAFLPPNQSLPNLNAFSSSANAANGIDRQNGSAMTGGGSKAAFDNTGGRQNSFSVKSDGDGAANRQSAEMAVSTPAIGGLGFDALVDAGQMAMIGNDGHRQDPHHQNDRSMEGNLARWFGSDVFHQHMPPLLAPAGQKVLTVDEIECWQQSSVSKS